MMKPYLRKSLLALFALSALLVPAASASATGGALAPGGPSEWISNFGTRGTGVEIRPMIRDVNLDSKADAVLVYNGDWYVALSNGTTFGTYSLWLDGPSPTTSGVKYMLANTTGDSRLDAVSVEKGDWKSWAGQPGSFSSTAVVRSGFGVPVAGKTTNWLTGDVTGDGKADLVTVDNNKWSVVPATSSILDPPVTMYTYPTAISDSTVKSAMLSDRTNDNRADAWTVNPITGMWNVQDSLGNTLSPTSLSYDTGLPAGDNVFKALIDVNADNRLDAVTQVNGMWGIALRNATGFDTPKPWDKGFAQPPTGSDVPMIGDLNFDGSADPVGFSNGTWYAATALSVGAQIKAGAAGWTPSVLFDEFDGTRLSRFEVEQSAHRPAQLRLRKRPSVQQRRRCVVWAGTERRLAGVSNSNAEQTSVSGERSLVYDWLDQQLRAIQLPGRVCGGANCCPALRRLFSGLLDDAADEGAAARGGHLRVLPEC
jgi:hypothetical protein